jgi:hypothetical protein
VVAVTDRDEDEGGREKVVTDKDESNIVNSLLLPFLR